MIRAMRTILPLLLLCALCASAPGAQAQPGPGIPLPKGTRIFKDLAYVPGGHERQKLDLYLPATGSRWPLVVAIHGGAFRMGSKDGEPAGAFVARGFAVAAINYRLSQHAVFPAQIEDCKAAVRWLRANAGQYGYDPARIASYGASAGGHLAAMLGSAGDIGGVRRGRERRRLEPGAGCRRLLRSDRLPADGRPPALAAGDDPRHARLARVGARGRAHPRQPGQGGTRQPDHLRHRGRPPVPDRARRRRPAGAPRPERAGSTARCGRPASAYSSSRSPAARTGARRSRRACRWPSTS